MAEYVFVGVMICLLFIDASLVWSIKVPASRIWPPPGRASWQYWFTWLLFSFAVIGTVALGLLDWNGLALSAELRLAWGIPVVAVGVLFGLWAVRALGLHSSQGLGGELVTGGPYRYSRNPQYVGNICLVVGFGWLSGSGLALGTSLLLALWFVLAPFAEEPWLQGKLGEPYSLYSSQTPRFLGW